MLWRRRVSRPGTADLILLMLAPMWASNFRWLSRLNPRNFNNEVCVISSRLTVTRTSSWPFSWSLNSMYWVLLALRFCRLQSAHHCLAYDSMSPTFFVNCNILLLSDGTVVGCIVSSAYLIVWGAGFKLLLAKIFHCRGPIIVLWGAPSLVLKDGDVMLAAVFDTLLALW